MLANMPRDFDVRVHVLEGQKASYLLFPFVLVNPVFPGRAKEWGHVADCVLRSGVEKT